MFNDMFVVSTALNSFNNAALLNPLFLSVGVLTIPLFLLVIFYGRDFVSRFGWNSQNTKSQISFWFACFLVLWMLLFGGNYAVIRDGISLVPFVLSVILFVLMIIISNNMVTLKYINKLQQSKSKWLLFFVLLFGAVFSGVMTWWGILLQVSAVISGLIVGCRLNRHYSWFCLIDFICIGMTVLILMQPEYFRFGQLGNLTIIHLTAIMLVSWFAVTALVAKYVNARGKIRQSAFIKLKWLLRIVAVLAVILFISTESVPVLIGLLFVVGLLESLSVYHSLNICSGLYQYAWAIMLVVFGIIIICPGISALGILYLTLIPAKIHIKDFLRLL